MRIEKKQSTYTQPNFKSGKVRVFSDFDKTFLPAKQKDFAKLEDSNFIITIKETFKNFKEFLNNTKDGLKFTITTGRTFGEFLTMAEIARKRKFDMPLPDTLIIKNGSDEHIRIGTDEDFYNGGKFPFEYEITNKEKEEKIKKLSGWDGTKIKKIIYDILKSYNFRIIEADSENSVSDYGPRSMFSQDKIPYEPKETLNETNKADWSVGIRKDGNLKIYFTLPTDMLDIEERHKIYNQIQSKIREQAKIEGINYIEGDGPHTINGRPALSYTPTITYNDGTENLTKLYDTYDAFQKAQKNNDLIIVAGDGTNDLEMLNPGNYLKDYFTEEMYKKYGREQLNSKVKSPNDLIKLLDNNTEIADIFIKMPFRGIIVRQNNGKNDLPELEQFTQGKYQKIIVVNEGELQNGIKQSIKAYCEQNPKYKEILNEDLKKQIHPHSNKSNNEDNSDNNNNDDNGNDNNKNNPKSSVWKYILGASAIIGIGSGIYLRNKKQDKNKNNITNEQNS